MGYERHAMTISIGSLTAGVWIAATALFWDMSFCLVHVLCRIRVGNSLEYMMWGRVNCLTAKSGR